ncbi:hypothetical protein LCGC14_2330690 [marine sediment metagenome]|uniref:Uncharacterized protein n=1 Tax=marine sediment metagenome TaxID=412755 RepID=A0A0F9F9Y8_9ZZZZ
MSEYAFAWAFLVDTDGKAWVGNFERELCAYCTGLVGGCEKGEEEAYLFQSDFGLESDEESPFFEKVNCYVMDDVGCGRPAAIWISPGDKRYAAVAIFFYEKPTDELISIIKERAYKFAEERPDREKYEEKIEKINITGFRLIEQTVTEKESAV